MSVVTVYTKPDCQPCKGTKRKLDKEGIEYTELSLEEDAEAVAKAKELGYTQAPVVVVDLGEGNTWSWCGFQPTQIAKLKNYLATGIAA